MELKNSNTRKGLIVGLTLFLIFAFVVSPVLGDVNNNNKLKVYDKSGHEVQQAEIPDSPKPAEEEEEEDQDISPIQMGSKMVGEGVVYGVELIGDAGLQTINANTSSETGAIKDNYGQVVAVIYNLATVEFNPFDHPFVRELQIKFGIVGLFLILMFILLGATNVNLFATARAYNIEKAWILSNRYRLPINEYALTMAEACIMMAAGYVILRVTIMTELLFSKLIMFQVLDMITPTGGNVVMYLMMSICYLFISIVLAFRLMVVGLFCASYIAFIGLYCFGITRQIAVSAWWYFVKILFLRTIIIGVTVAGIKFISFFSTAQGGALAGVVNVLYMIQIQPIMYVALILILLLVCFAAIAGLTSLGRVTKAAMRSYGLRVPY